MAHKLVFRKARTLLVKPQTAKKAIDKKRDAQRRALKPGLRISSTGTIYSETRANRSDINPSKKL